MSTLARAICYSEPKSEKKLTLMRARLATRPLFFYLSSLGDFGRVAMTKKKTAEAAAETIDNAGIATADNVAAQVVTENVATQTTTKTATKTTTRRKARKEKQMDAAQVHAQIAGIVKGSATKIAQALIDRALNGDAPAAKYLFEFARIFPAADDTNADAKEEDSLAKTLMHRLNLPEEPIKLDDDEDDKEATEEKDGAANAKTDCVVVVGAIKND